MDLIYLGNKSILELRDNDKITIKEHNLLFEDKSDWFEINNLNEQSWKKSQAKCSDFWDIFHKIKILFESNDSMDKYDFTYIQFPSFGYSSDTILKTYNKDVDFSYSLFAGKTHFDDVNFQKNVKFSNSKFFYDTYFLNTKFGTSKDNEINFNGSIFIDIAIFSGSEFFGETTFLNSVFEKQGNFLSTISRI